jgi:hypothetical protein
LRGNQKAEEMMQNLFEASMVEVDKKVVGGVKLPRTLILYTVDADHFVLSHAKY